MGKEETPGQQALSFYFDEPDDPAGRTQADYGLAEGCARVGSRGRLRGNIVPPLGSL